MTLLTTEGFETRVAKDGWAISNLSFAAGRYGGSCMVNGSASYALPTPTDVVVLGFAYQVPASPSNRSIIELYDGGSGSAQIRVQLRTDRYLEVQRSSSPIASSAGPIGGGGDWVFIETKTRLNDVTGFCEIKVNGSVVLSFTGDTVGNTAAGANNGVTAINFVGSSTHAIDDIYICDALGAAPYNNYIGDVQIETLVPNGNGAFSQLVGSDGNSVDNYLLVDELPAVDTDYAASSTAGQRDLYTFTDPAAGVGEVLAVMPCIAVSKVLAGPATIKIVDRTAAGTERISAAKQVLNLGWRTSAPYVADAAGAAWTPASVAGAQFGAEVG